MCYILSMAAQKKKKEAKINLLPREEFATSTLGRILSWALSTFRIIVIAVELIVVVAFLSRFWLDARITDLSDEIKQKGAIVASQAAFEKEFRDAQTKLKIFSELTDGETNLQLLQETASLLPSDTTFDSFSITNNEAQIKADALSEESIAQYIASLRNASIFKQINLNQVESRAESPFITFTLKATIE